MYPHSGFHPHESPLGHAIARLSLLEAKMAGRGRGRGRFGGGRGWAARGGGRGGGRGVGDAGRGMVCACEANTPLLAELRNFDEECLRTGKVKLRYVDYSTTHTHAFRAMEAYLVVL